MIEKTTCIQAQVLSSVTVMHRMFRNLCSEGGTGTAASKLQVFLVHQSGVVLSDVDGEPLWFTSADTAGEFARRYLCEPLAYETRTGRDGRRRSRSSGTLCSHWAGDPGSGLVGVPFDPPLNLPVDLVSRWPPAEDVAYLVQSALRARDSEGVDRAPSTNGAA
jgi:hypothetical protein